MGYVLCTGPDCPICLEHDARKAPDEPAWVDQGTSEDEPVATEDPPG